MESREIFIEWLDHEIEASSQMLRWFESVSIEHRDFNAVQNAVNLVGHLAACRHNWLDRMSSKGLAQVDWWPKDCDLVATGEMLLDTLANWRNFLEPLDENTLDQDFEYCAGGDNWRFNIRAQTMQMIGHGFYHRGQIALLLCQTGAQVTDTDFLYWKLNQQPSRWGRI